VANSRNYKKEAAYEDRPDQVKRREARNRARSQAMILGKVRKGDGKELDHQGHHQLGAHALDRVPVKVVPKSVNRKRQPPHKRHGR